MLIFRNIITSAIGILALTLNFSSLSPLGIAQNSIYSGTLSQNVLSSNSFSTSTLSNFSAPLPAGYTSSFADFSGATTAGSFSAPLPAGYTSSFADFSGATTAGSFSTPLPAGYTSSFADFSGATTAGSFSTPLPAGYTSSFVDFSNATTAGTFSNPANLTQNQILNIASSGGSRQSIVSTLTGVPTPNSNQAPQTYETQWELVDFSSPDISASFNPTYNHNSSNQNNPPSIRGINFPNSNSQSQSNNNSHNNNQGSKPSQPSQTNQSENYDFSNSPNYMSTSTFPSSGGNCGGGSGGGSSFSSVSSGNANIPQYGSGMSMSSGGGSANSLGNIPQPGSGMTASGINKADRRNSANSINNNNIRKSINFTTQNRPPKPNSKPNTPQTSSTSSMSMSSNSGGGSSLVNIPQSGSGMSMNSNGGGMPSMPSMPSMPNGIPQPGSSSSMSMNSSGGGGGSQCEYNYKRDVEKGEASETWTLPDCTKIIKTRCKIIVERPMPNCQTQKTEIDRPGCEDDEPQEHSAFCPECEDWVGYPVFDCLPLPECIPTCPAQCEEPDGNGGCRPIPDCTEKKPPSSEPKPQPQPNSSDDEVGGMTPEEFQRLIDENPIDLDDLNNSLRDDLLDNSDTEVPDVDLLPSDNTNWDSIHENFANDIANNHGQDPNFTLPDIDPQGQMSPDYFASPNDNNNFNNNNFNNSFNDSSYGPTSWANDQFGYNDGYNDYFGGGAGSGFGSDSNFGYDFGYGDSFGNDFGYDSGFGYDDFGYGYGNDYGFGNDFGSSGSAGFGNQLGADSSASTNQGFWGNLGNSISNGWDSVTNSVGNAWDAGTELAGNAWNSVTDFAGNAWNAGTEFAGNAWDSVTEFAGNAWNSVTEFAGNAWNSVTDFAGNAWNATTDFLSSETGTRVLGGFQAVGSVFEGAVATAGVLAPEPLTTAGGLALGAHAVDSLQAGIRQMWTGESVDSFTHQGISDGLETLGVGPTAADWIATGSEFGAGFVSFGGAVSSIGRSGNYFDDALRGIDNLGESGTTLYRAVSQAELDDVLNSGVLRAGGSSSYESGKFFAESFDDAYSWGNALEGTGNFSVIEVDFPNEIADQFMRFERLDNIGPARFGTFEQIGTPNIRIND